MVRRGGVAVRRRPARGAEAGGRREGAGTPRLTVPDALLLSYLLATAVVAAVGGGWRGAALAAAHAAGAAGVAALARRPLPEGSVARFVRVFYPLALTPLLYSEIEVVNQLLASGYFDATVQGWEERVFGAQLSVVVARRSPSLWLSELLHLGYLSYYAVVPLAALLVYRRAGVRGLERLTAAVLLAFLVCYACFIVFPVSGPRYEFPPIGGEPARGVVFGVVHAVLEAGSARGTAFPSSHIAAAGAAYLAARAEGGVWSRVLLLPVALLVLGTVYGRFHYGVDAVAGGAVAAGAWAATPWLERRLGPQARRGPRSGGQP